MDKALSATEIVKEVDQLADLAGMMRQTQEKLAFMETLFRRRFDEISMEINATSQQVDMAEEGMAKRFGEILNVMNAISYSGDGSTPANTGVELEAVIADTTKAANTILDETDRMNDVLYGDEACWADPQSRAALLESLRGSVQTIMLSCSFQDVTSQRIRKTLESLNDIEERISTTLESMGIAVPAHAPVEKGDEKLIVKGNSQDDIDALFS